MYMHTYMYMYACITVYTVCLNVIQERVYRPTESRQVGVIDPQGKVMILHLYAGLLKVTVLNA